MDKMEVVDLIERLRQPLSMSMFLTKDDLLREQSIQRAEAVEVLTSAQAEIERLTTELEEAWKAAHNAVTSCVANWAQDCKSAEERRILSELGKGLADEIATSSPGDWLGIEWLTAKDATQAITRAESAEKERDALRGALKPFADICVPTDPTSRITVTMDRDFVLSARSALQPLEPKND